jgi:hypothetical protein
MQTEHFKAPTAIFHFVARNKDGKIKWEETIHNLITTEGGNDLLTKYFKGSSYSAAWYCLLKGSGTWNGLGFDSAVGDTLASHAGWSEITAYSGNRPALTFGTASARSLSATAVTYTFSGAATVAGAGVCTVATGTSGILYNSANFTGGDKTMASGETLDVTVTFSNS